MPVIDYLTTIIHQKDSQPLVSVVVEARKQTDGSIMALATTNRQGVATFTGLSESARFVARSSAPVLYLIESSKGTPSSLEALATSSVTLSTGLQDVPGASVLLPVAATYVILGVFDFSEPGLISGQIAFGALDVGAVDQGELAVMRPIATNQRATVSQVWRVTTSADNVIAKLRVFKTGAGSLACLPTHTKIVSSSFLGGSAGGGAGVSDHALLTNVQINQHHNRDHVASHAESGIDSLAGEIVDVRRLDVQGSAGLQVLLSQNGEGYLSVRNNLDNAYERVKALQAFLTVAATDATHAVRKGEFDAHKHAAVGYIPFGSEPVQGQSFTP